jgi:hypothetical protein
MLGRIRPPLRSFHSGDSVSIKTTQNIRAAAAKEQLRSGIAAKLPLSAPAKLSENTPITSCYFEVGAGASGKEKRFSFKQHASPRNKIMMGLA